MALVQNDKGQWAWVYSADEHPEKFFDNQSEAVANRNQGTPNTTIDSVGDRKAVYSTDRGEWQ